MSRIYVYTDTETLPTDRVDVIERLVAKIEAPSNYKDAEKITAYRNEKAADAVNRTALSGLFGRICVAAWAINNFPVCAYTAMDPVSTEETTGDAPAVFDEKGLLFDFFQAVDSEIESKFRSLNPNGFANHAQHTVTVVGHNVAGFDLPMIRQRTIVLGIPLALWFPLDAKPWDEAINDTMLMWADARGTVSMSDFCMALGIPDTDPISGAEVARVWSEGRFEVVRDHCIQDVEKVRAVHKRMLKAFARAA
jgi:hypothetical protein